MSRGPAIETRGLRKSYGDNPVLGGVTFTVGRGESYGLLGYEESGKTSLVRILSTSLEASGGSAHVLGDSVRDDADQIDRHVGVLFGEDAPIEPQWTALEYLEYFDRLHRSAVPVPGQDAGLFAGWRSRSRERKRRREELAWMIKGVGADPLAPMERVPPGARRRVDLLRALLHDPPILLLDEPTKGLDFHAREELLRDVETWRDGGPPERTLVVSSSDLHEVVRLCPRVGILQKGLLLWERDLTGVPFDEAVGRLARDLRMEGPRKLA